MLHLLATITIAGVALTNTQLLLAALPVLLVVYTLWVHRGYSSSNPLVWSWVPHLRSALLFGADPNTFLAKCKQACGPIFTLNLGGRHITFITDPQCYPHITKARDGLSFAEVAVGVSLQVLDEPPESAYDKELDAGRHMQYTKYLNGAPLDEITERFGDFLQEWLHLHCKAEQGKTAAKGEIRGGLLDLTTRAIFSASTRALYGDILVDGASTPEKFDESFTDDFYAPKTLLSTFKKFDDVFPLLYGGLPAFLLKEGVTARANLISALKTLKKDHSTFMAERKELMIDNPPTKRPATDPKSFGGSQLGMLWALQGNTIPATFWVLFYLIQNPKDLARVQSQVREVIEESNKDNPAAKHNAFHVSIGRDSLKKLTLLDCAISEALRLATGSMMMRKATADFTLDLPTGPLPVKKGMNLAIYPYLTHHDATLFPEPEKFNLDRWIDKPIDIGTITNIHGEKIPNAFLPFGAGISMCPGRHFARNEIKMFVTSFLNRFDIETQPGVQSPGYLLSRSGLGIFPPAKDIQISYTPKA